MIFEDLGLLFFTALLLSLLLTPATVAFAQRIGAMDTPNDRSVHVRIMPRMGGLGMAMSIMVALLLFVELTPTLVAFLLGMIIIVGTGIVDDLFQIRPRSKMAGQVIACTVFLLLSDLRMDSIGDIFALGSIDFESLGFVVSLFCMIGLVNAFNLSDGLDGLAAGITLIIAVFMGLLALLSQNWLALSIIAALWGGALGFLKYNSYPAKLFMGDTGSLMLGFVMACLLIMLLDFQGEVRIPAVTLLLVLALPVSDTLLVMSTRILQGRSPVSADRTHLHHRLLDLGFSHALVVIIMYFFASFFGFLAVTLYMEPDWLQLLAGLGSCMMLYGSLWFSERSGWHVKEHSLFQTSSKVLASHLVSVAGKSLKWLRVTILLGLLVPLFFVQSIPSDVHNLLISVCLLLLFAYPWREHKAHLNVAYALFYVAGLTILYVWNVAKYEHFSLTWYSIIFIGILLLWSMFKIRFKGHKEVFLTSGLELLLIFVSWFIPYVLLPVLEVSDHVLMAAKASCLEAVPLFIAMKIVIRKQPDRNHLLAIGLILILLLILLQYG